MERHVAHDDSLANAELATKVETMERTCEQLDEQLAAMHAAESALQSRGAASAKATTVARHATARVDHLHSESSALQHRCSSLQDQLQQLPVHGLAVPLSPPPLTASVADALALAAAADGWRSPLPPPPLPPQFGELWSHAAAADALALERLSDPMYPRLSTPREQILISELSKKSQQVWHVGT